MPDRSENMKRRLLAYRGQRVRRREGVPLEDRVGLIPNLEYDREELDLYSEVDPLRENIPPLRGPKKISYIATHHRREALTEILPTFPALVRMEVLQERVDRRLLAGHHGRTPDPARLKRDIRGRAASLGFALCGVTLLDTRFVTLGSDNKFPYPTAVVLGMEMRKEWLLEAPNYRLRHYPDYDVYRRAGNRVHHLADFIRSRGVSCSARVPFDGAVIYPVHAATAGLGELGAFGGILTREFGPRQRFCLLTVDADLPLDDPVDLGMSEICGRCLLCAKKCPAGAIPEEPVRWRGVRKWKINDLRCWAFFTAWHTCAVCMNACPLHRYGYRAVTEHFERTGEILEYESILAEKVAFRG